MRTCFNHVLDWTYFIARPSAYSNVAAVKGSGTSVKIAYRTAKRSREERETVLQSKQRRYRESAHRALRVMLNYFRRTPS